MTYENNIMYSEITSMKMIEELTNYPVAKIMYYDNSHTICDSDYFIMEKLDGNVFILNKRITGIIDFERCLWADELMEVGFRTSVITASSFKYVFCNS